MSKNIKIVDLNIKNPGRQTVGVFTNGIVFFPKGIKPAKIKEIFGNADFKIIRDNEEENLVYKMEILSYKIDRESELDREVSKAQLYLKDFE